MANKGRKNIPASGYKDTVVPGSAEQGMLVNQDAIVDQLNALVTKFNSLLAKLDTDSGVNSTDYASTLGTLTATTPKVTLK